MMTDTEYRRVVEGIVAESQRFMDGPASEPDVVFRRLAEAHAVAASLAPDGVSAEWATVAASFRRAADSIDSGAMHRATPEKLETERAAVKVVEDHVRATFGLDLNPKPRPHDGPPPQMPAEPAFMIPDGPVDQAEYDRRLADFDLTRTLEVEPQLTAVRTAEHFARITDVAPLHLRPAWAVLTAMSHDVVDRERDPALRRAPGRVSQDQIDAAVRTIEAAAVG